jgi:hypothetical protein
MKPEIKKLWVEALESGLYEQGTEYLKHIYSSKVEHCCLGVLCEVKAKKAHKKLNLDLMRKSEDIEMLNEETLRWAGLDDIVQKKLVNFNDDGKSFRWIASYIRRYL